MGVGSATWQLARGRLLRVLLPSKAKNELPLLQEKWAKGAFYQDQPAFCCVQG
jgi:hypothetical protein